MAESYRLSVLVPKVPIVMLILAGGLVYYLSCPSSVLLLCQLNDITGGGTGRFKVIVQREHGGGGGGGGGGEH